MLYNYSEEEINNHRLLFIEALESGNYKQTTGILRDEDCFCAEGVLCDVYMKAENDGMWGTEEGLDYYIFCSSKNTRKSIHIAPLIVMEWIGLKHTSGLITSLNDEKKLSFEQIAQLLRESWNLPKENENVSSN